MNPTDERTIDARHAHRVAVEGFLRGESNARGRKPPARIRPDPDPVEAPERILALVASRYAPGDMVTIRAVCDLVDCSTTTAYAVKRHGEAMGRWPYRGGLKYGGRPAV